jgi:hypothetical protein
MKAKAEARSTEYDRTELFIAWDAYAQMSAHCQHYDDYDFVDIDAYDRIAEFCRFGYPL